MPNQIINIIRMRLGSNPKQPKKSRPIQEILRLIREQDTNPNDGRVNSLTKKGLKALVSVLSTENDKPSSYNIQKLSKSNPGSRSSSEGQRSSSVGSRLSSVGQRLSSVGQRSSSVGSRLSSVGQRSSSVGQRSSSVGQRSSSEGQRSSSEGQRLSSNNDAIIEKLNYITIKILIAIISLAGNTLYLNNIIITSASFISIFQITLLIFFNCINKIESMGDNDLITEIDINIFLKTNDDNNIDMIGGTVYNKKYVLEIINILINAKSIQYRNAILYLFACIFVFVLLKKHEKYYSELKISGGGNKSQAKRNNMSKKT